MDIYPSIDIRGGRVVRLSKGDFELMTVYGDDPLRTAEGFLAGGAKYLHVVDLDGAKEGQAVNYGLISQLCEKHPGLFVEVGGGIRDGERAARYLAAGAGRVILGTAAVKNFALVEAAVAKHGDAVAVGVDARDGMVAVEGWQESTGIGALEFCVRLRDAGVHAVIYTDISKDGMLGGPNIGAYHAIASLGIPCVLASGGVSSVDDIRELKDVGVSGAIIGKALYEGRLRLEDALAAANAH